MSQYKGHDSEFCEKILLEYEQMFTPSGLINNTEGMSGSQLRASIVALVMR